MTNLSPGLYHVDATGNKKPLHTSGKCDIQALKAYLAEWDIDGIEVMDMGDTDE